MELKETVLMMDSPDYKERFKAEYYQTVIRYKKLCEMLDKWDSGKLDFEPPCSIKIYEQQRRAMYDYIDALTERAFEEEIDIEELI